MRKLLGRKKDESPTASPPNTPPTSSSSSIPSQSSPQSQSSPMKAQTVRPTTGGSGVQNQKSLDRRSVSGILPNSLGRSPSSREAPPLPSETELGQKFEALLDRRGVKGPQRDQMSKLPPEAKWTLVCQEAKAADSEQLTPEGAARLTNDPNSAAPQFDQVAVLLASQPVRWVAAYISAGGLKHLLNMLVNRVRNMQSEQLDGAATETICSGIRCLKAVMNAQLEASIECVNETKGVAGTLLVCVQIVPPRLGASLLEMLAAVAVATDRGHRAIRKPLITSNFLGFLAKNLLPNTSTGGAQMQIAAMTFLNAVLSGYSEEAKREEFLTALKTAAIPAVVADLRNTFANEDTTLVVHMQMQLDIFRSGTTHDSSEDDTTNTSGGDPASTSASPARQPAAAAAGGTSSSTLRLQAAGAAPPNSKALTSSSEQQDEKKGVSAGKRPKKDRKAGAAGSSAIESYELTIDRKDGPEALARELGENLRGTAVAKAFPKLLKAMMSMRTEGSIATASWGLLGAFVQVLSFMPEPEDGVAAPGELVNAACEALAEEFAVKLRGTREVVVVKEEPDPSADQSVLIAQLNARVEQLADTLQTSRDANERLKNDLEDANTNKQRLTEEHVAWQMQHHDQAERLKAQLNEAEEKLQTTTDALRSLSTSKRQRADAVSSPRSPRPESDEVQALKAEVEQLRSELEAAKQAAPAGAPANFESGTVRKPQRAAPEADAPTESTEPSAEVAQLRARVTDLESQLAAAVLAVADKPASTGNGTVADNDDIAPITGGPPPPPMPGGAAASNGGDAPITGGPPPPPMPGAGTAASEDAPITGGPPPPPAPGGGGPGAPPPPPMPGKKAGGAAAAEKKKADVKPNTKMKAFNWTKVPPRKVDGSIWSKVDDTKVKVDSKVLEDLFGAQALEAVKPTKSSASPASKDGKEQVITVLEPHRAQNLTILLSRFKQMTFVQLRKAIENLDTTVLTPDNLKALVASVPTHDEIELLKEHMETPADKLGKAEQYLIEMSRIPRLEERLESILFYSQFQGRFVASQQEVHVLRSACSEVRDNKRLQTLLEYILAIGNYINGSTFRGAAFGFKLDSLLKMLEVKSNDGRSTLMHYVVDSLEASPQLASLLEFFEDMPSVSAAARVQPLSQVTADVAKLGSGLVNIEKEVTQIDDSNDKFVAIMTKFHQVAATKVTGLREAQSKMSDSFKELLKFFCEDSTETTENFFGMIQRFVAAFQQARHDKKIWEQQQQAAEQSAERMKKLGIKGKPAQPGAAPGAVNPFAGLEKGSLDSMIQSLKSGTDNRLHRKSLRGLGESGGASQSGAPAPGGPAKPAPGQQMLRKTQGNNVK